LSRSVDGDSYLIPAGPATVESKVNGSRFVADLLSADTEDAALQAVDSVRRRMHDATHHCWAFSVGTDPARVRSTDDGEPSGTAGLPILRRIEASQLNNLVVIVTRYFGGTKLGTGGLIRAYGDVAGEVIAAARSRRVAVETTFTTEFEYGDTAAVEHAIALLGGRVTASTYGERAALAFCVPRSIADTVPLRFREATADRVHVRLQPDPKS